MSTRTRFVRFLGLPADRVLLNYVDGAGCYGMNGHDDALADAAPASRADEHGWDPKGPPQLPARLFWGRPGYCEGGDGIAETTRVS